MLPLVSIKNEYKDETVFWVALTKLPTSIGLCLMQALGTYYLSTYVGLIYSALHYFAGQSHRR